MTWDAFIIGVAEPHPLALIKPNDHKPPIVIIEVGIDGKKCIAPMLQQHRVGDVWFPLGPQVVRDDPLAL